MKHSNSRTDPDASRQLKVETGAGTTLYGVQTLRFIAATMVVLAHVADTLGKHNARYFDGWIGGAGVDIFFVISGYIMARLADVPSTGASVAAEFLSRRISRIVPIYWLVTVAVLALWWITRADLLTGLHLDNATARIVKSLLFFPGPIVVVGWTLTYEMAFYALIAASLTLPWRREIRYGVVAVILTVIALGILQTVVPNDPITWPRSAMITEFVMGIGMYVLTKKRTFPGWLAIASILMGIFCLRLGRHDHAINHGHPFWVAGATAITFAFVSAERMIPWPKLGIRLGDASYSVYLIHLYVVIYLDKILWHALSEMTGDILAASIFAVIAVMVSAAASLAIYEIVERPLTTYVQRRLVPASRHIFNRPLLSK